MSSYAANTLGVYGECYLYQCYLIDVAESIRYESMWIKLGSMRLYIILFQDRFELLWIRLPNRVHLIVHIYWVTIICNHE